MPPPQYWINLNNPTLPVGQAPPVSDNAAMPQRLPLVPRMPALLNPLSLGASGPLATIAVVGLTLKGFSPEILSSGAGGSSAGTWVASSWETGPLSCKFLTALRNTPTSFDLCLRRVVVPSPLTPADPRGIKDVWFVFMVLSVLTNGFTL